MPCRGVRGAICAESNELHTIIDATRRLLQRIVDANSIQKEDVAGIVFTATPDLDAAYPALGAREMGWTDVPLLCVQEMAVEGSLTHCIRVLLSWNTELPQAHIRHVYLGKARQLRPDLAQSPSEEERTCPA